MVSSMRLVLLLVAFAGMLIEKQEAVTFKEYRKALLNFNPAVLQPQCRIVFQKCAPKLFSMITVLDNVDKRWKEFESIPCVQKVFDRGFPDYSRECEMSGLYGEAVKCQLTDEVLEIYGQKEKLKPAMECLLKNAKP